MYTVALQLSKYKSLLAIMFTLLLGTLFAVVPASAADLDGDGIDDGAAAAGQGVNDIFGIDDLENGDEKLKLGKRSLPDTIAGIINIALGFLGIVSVVIILVGGARWMTSMGNPDNVDQSKKIIIAGIVGLGIILASWSIAKFALVKLGQATNVQGADQLQF